MKIKFLLFLLFISATCFAQDSLSVAPVQQTDTIRKTNPIIFASGGTGVTFGGIDGLNLNGQLVYGYKNNLFAVRTAATVDITYQEFALIIPALLKKKQEELFEYGLMYGRQFASGGHAFNIMLGASYNKQVVTYRWDGPDRKVRNNFIGIPFEASVLWFKGEKKRLRFLGIPIVRRPTAFGYHIGFKFSGSIGERGYAAIGLVYGLGMHKHY